MALKSASILICRQFHWLCSSQSSVNQLRCSARLFHSSVSIRNKAVDSKTHGFFKASEKKVARFKLQDSVSKDYILIYKAPMESYMKYGYPVMLVCAITPPVLLFYDYYTRGRIVLQKESNSLPFINPERELCIFGISMALFAWAVFALIFRYPFRIYKHKGKQEYVAIFLSAAPLRLRQFCFESATRKKFRNPLFAFIDESCHYFLNGKKKAFLLGHYFRTPADLGEMEGMETWRRM